MFPIPGNGRQTSVKCTLKPNQGSNTRSSAVGQNYTCFCFPIWSQLGSLKLESTGVFLHLQKMQNLYPELLNPVHGMGNPLLLIVTWEKC